MGTTSLMMLLVIIPVCRTADPAKDNQSEIRGSLAGLDGGRQYGASLRHRATEGRRPYPIRSVGCSAFNVPLGCADRSCTLVRLADGFEV
jgi:hypothetical protein